jgi:hypothetical protein
MSLESAIEEKIKEQDRGSMGWVGLFKTAQTEDTTYIEMNISKGNSESCPPFIVSATLAAIDETSGGTIRGTVHGSDKVFRWELPPDKRGFNPDTLRQYLLANMRIH